MHRSCSPRSRQARRGRAAEAKPQTPADIINARGFWDDDAGRRNRKTAAQVIAAVAARKALEAADPQSTASTSAPYQAHGLCAACPPADHSNVVAASAPIPRSTRPAAARNPNAATDINTIAAKGHTGQGEPVANATRLSAPRATISGCGSSC